MTAVLSPRSAPLSASWRRQHPRGPFPLFPLSSLIASFTLAPPEVSTVVCPTVRPVPDVRACPPPSTRSLLHADYPLVVWKINSDSTRSRRASLAIRGCLNDPSGTQGLVIRVSKCEILYMISKLLLVQRTLDLARRQKDQEISPDQEIMCFKKFY